MVLADSMYIIDRYLEVDEASESQEPTVYKNYSSELIEVQRKLQLSIMIQLV